MEISVFADGVLLPSEQAHGVIAIRCKKCNNLLGFSDLMLRYLRKSQTEKIQIKIADKTFDPVPLPEHQSVCVIKCSVCGNTQEV